MNEDTIDLPDALLHRTKATAGRRHTTLRKLVMDGLEYVLNHPSALSSKPLSPLSDTDFFETDEFGVPVLKRRGVMVTDGLIEKRREEEGI